MQGEVSRERKLFFKIDVKKIIKNFPAEIDGKLNSSGDWGDRGVFDGTLKFEDWMVFDWEY